MFRAIADFNRALELDPGSAAAFGGRGAVHLDKREYDLAIVDLSKAIALSPMYAGAYRVRGIAYYRKREYDQAISDFSKAIQLDPNDAGASRYRGLAYTAISDRERATSDGNEAMTGVRVKIPYFWIAITIIIILATIRRIAGVRSGREAKTSDKALLGTYVALKSAGMTEIFRHVDVIPTMPWMAGRTLTIALLCSGGRSGRHADPKFAGEA